MQPPASRKPKPATGVAKMLADAQKKAAPPSNTTVTLGKMTAHLSEASYFYEDTNGCVLDYKTAKEKNRHAPAGGDTVTAWRMIERQRASVRVVCGIKNQSPDTMAIVNLGWHPLKSASSDERWLHVRTSEGVESELMFSGVSFFARANTTVPRAWPPQFVSSATFCEIPSSAWTLRVTYKLDDIDESGFCVFIRATPNRGAHSQVPTFASRTQRTYWWLHSPPDLLFTVSGTAGVRGACQFGLAEVDLVVDEWRKHVNVPRFCLPQGALVLKNATSRAAKPPRKRPNASVTHSGNDMVIVLGSEAEPPAPPTDDDVPLDVQRAVEAFYVLENPGDDDKSEAPPLLVESHEAEVAFPHHSVERRRTHDIETPSWAFVLDIIQRADLSMDLLSRSLASAYCNPEHTPSYPINCWI
ncbi:hypothetical protein [Medusavirus stheno T3]|uniref:Uncharacterized protein n=1 Tax=Medusavirus stheno T3 TaxID=3069717 RepID=A0A7S8BCW8_9VIRU|nr:hypothetical protein QKU73_gp003 [Acanthamoeba castellanii medusavirus]QPB44184.1 hypothetical protein [Medusavirus stheno T3]